LFGISGFTLIKWGVILYVLGLIIKNGQVKSLGETVAILGIAIYILDFII